MQYHDLEHTQKNWQMKGILQDHKQSCDFLSDFMTAH